MRARSTRGASTGASSSSALARAGTRRCTRWASTSSAGRSASALRALRGLLGYSTGAITLLLDGQRRISSRTPTVLIANGPFLGSSFAVAPTSRLDDGLLTVMLFEGFSRADLLTYFAAVAEGRPREDWRVVSHRATQVEVTSPAGLPAHADGQPIGPLATPFDALPAGHPGHHPARRTSGADAPDGQVAGARGQRGRRRRSGAGVGVAAESDAVQPAARTMRWRVAPKEPPVSPVAARQTDDFRTPAAGRYPPAARHAAAKARAMNSASASVPRRRSRRLDGGGWPGPPAGPYPMALAQSAAPEMYSSTPTAMPSAALGKPRPPEKRRQEGRDHDRGGDEGQVGRRLPPAVPGRRRPRCSPPADRAAAGARPAACSPAPVPLEHVIVIVLENRSFDHLYGTFPGPTAWPTPANGPSRPTSTAARTRRCRAWRGAGCQRFVSGRAVPRQGQNAHADGGRRSSQRVLPADARARRAGDGKGTAMGAMDAVNATEAAGRRRRAGPVARAGVLGGAGGAPHRPQAPRCAAPSRVASRRSAWGSLAGWSPSTGSTRAWRPARGRCRRPSRRLTTDRPPPEAPAQSVSRPVRGPGSLSVAVDAGAYTRHAGRLSVLSGDGLPACAVLCAVEGGGEPPRPPSGRLSYSWERPPAGRATTVLEPDCGSSGWRSSSLSSPRLAGHDRPLGGRGGRSHRSVRTLGEAPGRAGCGS